MDELEEVRVLRVQPGDVIVCTLHRNASHAEFAEIHARLQERFPDNAVTIVGQDAELSVVRPAKYVINCFDGEMTLRVVDEVTNCNRRADRTH